MFSLALIYATHHFDLNDLLTFINLKKLIPYILHKTGTVHAKGDLEKVSVIQQKEM